MSDKTPGRIGYEASNGTGVIARAITNWDELEAWEQEKWEMAAHAVQRALIERTLAGIEAYIGKKYPDLKEPDYSDESLTPEEYFSGPRDFRCLSRNDVEYKLDQAAEDRRETCSSGKCIQCRNPHYDGICSCGIVE